MTSKKTSVLRKVLAVMAVFAAALVLNISVQAAPKPMVYEYDHTNNKVTLCAAVSNTNNLVEYQIRKFSNGKLVDDQVMPYYRVIDGTTYMISNPISFSNNTVYKFRVRAVNVNTGKASAWTGYKFILPYVTMNGSSSTANSGQLKMAIRNVSGVKSYRIYASTSGANSGMVLRKTVNTTSATSVTTYVPCTAGKTNYIVVKAVLTNGKIAEIDNGLQGYIY